MVVDPEEGDVFVSRLAAHIRKYSRRLGQPPFDKKYAKQNHHGNMWPSPVEPLSLLASVAHLVYLFVRLDDLQLVSLEARDILAESVPASIHFPNPAIDGDGSIKDHKGSLSTRPTISGAAPDTHSIRESISSFLSIGSSSTKHPDAAQVDTYLQRLYSAFTVLPSLTIGASDQFAPVADFDAKARLPLCFVFRSLVHLCIQDIDPRLIILSPHTPSSLISLEILRSPPLLPHPQLHLVHSDLERETEEQQQEQGGTSAPGQSSIPDEHDYVSSVHSPVQEFLISNPTLFSNLVRLSICNCDLTPSDLDQVPWENASQSLRYLDLSGNLLGCIPSFLSSLSKLETVNLSDNLIASVSQVYQSLGQISSLNLSHNRIDLLAGLERLLGLERLDLSNNSLEDIDEIKRLVVLPHLKSLGLGGNPFTRMKRFASTNGNAAGTTTPGGSSSSSSNWRIHCFQLFASERLTQKRRQQDSSPIIELSIDGEKPSWWESWSLPSAKVSEHTFEIITPQIPPPPPHDGQNYATVSSSSATSSPPQPSSSSPKNTSAIPQIYTTTPSTPQTNSNTQSSSVLNNNNNDNIDEDEQRQDTVLDSPRHFKVNSKAKAKGKGKGRARRIIDLDGKYESQQEHSPASSYKPQTDGDEGTLDSNIKAQDSSSNLRDRIEALRGEAGTNYVRILAETDEYHGDQKRPQSPASVISEKKDSDREPSVQVSGEEGKKGKEVETKEVEAKAKDEPEENQVKQKNGHQAENQPTPTPDIQDDGYTEIVKKENGDKVEAEAEKDEKKALHPEQESPDQQSTSPKSSNTNKSTNKKKKKSKGSKGKRKSKNK